ncbi:hypothetical protein [Legionella lansingensis]|uniref:hypothetical protein n=1 Tax=Legionella lansingensis TaxID=45067 RepID=UPI0004914CB9|nr:hypothetical protein [Legionella lansingensis]
MFNKKFSLWLGYDFVQSIHRPKRIHRAIWEQGELKMIDSKSLSIMCATGLMNDLVQLDEELQ